MPKLSFSFKNAKVANNICYGNRFIKEGSFHFEKCESLNQGFRGCYNAKRISITGNPPTDLTKLFYQSNTDNHCLEDCSFYDVFPAARENKDLFKNTHFMAYMCFQTKLNGNLGDFDEDGNPTDAMDFGTLNGISGAPSQYGLYNAFNRTNLSKVNIKCSGSSTDSNSASGLKSAFSQSTIDYIKVWDTAGYTDQYAKDLGMFICDNCTNLKRADFRLPIGCANYILFGCAALEELYITNEQTAAFGYNIRSMLTSCASLRKFIFTQDSPRPTSFLATTTSAIDIGSWGNGVTHLDLESIQSFAWFFGNLTPLTTIFDPAKQSLEAPNKYSHTLGQLGLDKQMVDSNGIKCIITKKEAETQKIEYDFVDNFGTGTYCVRKDSELYTALHLLEEKGLVWGMAYN